MATTKLEFHPRSADEKAGLVVFGMDYATLVIEKSGAGYRIVQRICLKAEKGSREEIVASIRLEAPEVFLRVAVKPEKEDEVIPNVLCSFSYSVDGNRYTPVGKEFVAREGQWVGAKVGIFAMTGSKPETPGYADFDWFRIQPFSER